MELVLLFVEVAAEVSNPLSFYQFLRWCHMLGVLLRELPQELGRRNRLKIGASLIDLC